MASISARGNARMQEHGNDLSARREPETAPGAGAYPGAADAWSGSRACRQPTGRESSTHASPSSSTHPGHLIFSPRNTRLAPPQLLNDLPRRITPTAMPSRQRAITTTAMLKTTIKSIRSPEYFVTLQVGTRGVKRLPATSCRGQTALVTPGAPRAIHGKTGAFPHGTPANSGRKERTVAATNK